MYTAKWKTWLVHLKRDLLKLEEHYVAVWNKEMNKKQVV